MTHRFIIYYIFKNILAKNTRKIIKDWNKKKFWIYRLDTLIILGKWLDWKFRIRNFLIIVD